MLRLTLGTSVAALFLSGLVVSGAPHAAAAPSQVDVLFVFDVTGSMGGALNEAKAQVVNSIADVRTAYPDSRFGVMTVGDYFPDIPFTLPQPITDDVEAVQAAITPLYASGGGDGPEAYTRALYEARADASVGWRDSAKRLVVLINDNMPHDNDLNEGVPVESQTINPLGVFDTGTDPGPDAAYGTADDLDWQETLGGLKTDGIVFASVLYSGSGSYLPYWEWWTKSTGGVTAVGGDGTPLGETLTSVVLSGVTGGTSYDFNKDGVVRVADLGDSFAAGEGLLDGRYDCGTALPSNMYFEGTNVVSFKTVPGVRPPWKATDCQTASNSTAEPSDNWWTRKATKYWNTCHRTGEAYGPLLWAKMGVTGGNGLFNACSGAKSKNTGLLTAASGQYAFQTVADTSVGGVRCKGIDPNKAQYPFSPYGVNGGCTQEVDLANFAKGGAPDVITISMGGNDLGPDNGGGVGDIIKDCVLDGCSNTNALITRIKGTATQDGVVEQRVRQVLNGLKLQYPTSRILVIGYPRIFGDFTACLSGGVIFPSKTRAWIDGTLIPTLNKTVQDVSAEAGVTFVDVFNLARGHEACALTGAWINGIRGTGSSESFHPNERWHAAAAQYILDGYLR